MYDLCQTGPHSVSVVDNVLVAHNLKSKVFNFPCKFFGSQTETLSFITQQGFTFVRRFIGLEAKSYHAIADWNARVGVWNEPEISGSFPWPRLFCRQFKRVREYELDRLPDVIHFDLPHYFSRSIWKLEMNFESIANSWQTSRRIMLVDFLLKRSSIAAKALIFKIIRSLVIFFLNTERIFSLITSKWQS